MERPREFVENGTGGIELVDHGNWMFVPRFQVVQDQDVAVGGVDSHRGVDQRVEAARRIDRQHRDEWVFGRFEDLHRLVGGIGHVDPAAEDSESIGIAEATQPDLKWLAFVQQRRTGGSIGSDVRPIVRVDVAGAIDGDAG